MDVTNYQSSWVRFTHLPVQDEVRNTNDDMQYDNIYNNKTKAKRIAAVCVQNLSKVIYYKKQRCPKDLSFAKSQCSIDNDKKSPSHLSFYPYLYLTYPSN